MSANLNELPAWSSAGFSLLKEISRPGCVAMVVGPPSSSRSLVKELAAIAGEVPLSLTEALLTNPTEKNELALLDQVGVARFLLDLEALCWRGYWNIDPVRFCRTLARRRGVLALWPGEVHRHVLTFSAPGRPDHFELSASGLLLVGWQSTHYPDETPFLLERVPA